MAATTGYSRISASEVASAEPTGQSGTRQRLLIGLFKDYHEGSEPADEPPNLYIQEVDYPKQVDSLSAAMDEEPIIIEGPQDLARWADETFVGWGLYSLEVPLVLHRTALHGRQRQQRRFSRGHIRQHPLDTVARDAPTSQRRTKLTPLLSTYTDHDGPGAENHVRLRAQEAPMRRRCQGHVDLLLEALRVPIKENYEDLLRGVIFQRTMLALYDRVVACADVLGPLRLGRLGPRSHAPHERRTAPPSLMTWAGSTWTYRNWPTPSWCLR